jgi:hypothetical protein
MGSRGADGPRTRVGGTLWRAVARVRERWRIRGRELTCCNARSGEGPRPPRGRRRGDAQGAVASSLRMRAHAAEQLHRPRGAARAFRTLPALRRKRESVSINLDGLDARQGAVVAALRTSSLHSRPPSGGAPNRLRDRRLVHATPSFLERLYLLKYVIVALRWM